MMDMCLMKKMQQQQAFELALLEKQRMVILIAAAIAAVEEWKMPTEKLTNRESIQQQVLVVAVVVGLLKEMNKHLNLLAAMTCLHMRANIQVSLKGQPNCYSMPQMPQQLLQP